MLKSTFYIGLISGTSVDGVDCVLVEFQNDKPKLIETHFQPSPSELRQSILSLCSGAEQSLITQGVVDIQIGEFFAKAVAELLKKANKQPEDIAAIGSHGQTVWHQPTGSHPFTLQLGDASTIAFKTRITTVADFRRMDVAAGGQGAPLAPLLHRNVFGNKEANHAVVNIGGISNISCFPMAGDELAFDTGPGNVLMDYWIGKHQHKRFDESGRWAATGKVSASLLSSLLKDDYFDLPHPKSTGRELFNGEWLEAKLVAFDSLATADVQATLLEFTAATIAAELNKLMQVDALFVCGGGAHNQTLMQALAMHLPGSAVSSTAALGMNPDWVEAIAFAWMAKQRMDDKAIDTRAFTGARSPVKLGGIYSG